MSNPYVSKYPTIVADKTINSVNESMIKKITVEEYYDLKHHTHNISNLAVGEGSMSYNEMETIVNNLLETVNKYDATIQEQQNYIIELQQSNNTMQSTINTLTETVNNASDTILQQNDIIQRLEADTTEFKRLIAIQNDTINVMKTEMENMTSVGDWDIETPGIQDHEGNTLGELMGFTMTEIQ